jgi:RNA polymerase sigma-70 factor (ECF subfamily)
MNEDLFHTVFQALLENDCRKLRQFQGRCSLSGWLGIISTRIVIDHLRKQRNLLSLDVEDDEGIRLIDRMAGQHPSVSLEEDLSRRQELSLVSAALETASPEDRLLAVLAFQRDLPVHEIAGVLNISQEAVHVRKHRLKERLRSKLEDAGFL